MNKYAPYDVESGDKVNPGDPVTVDRHTSSARYWLSIRTTAADWGSRTTCCQIRSRDGSPTSTWLNEISGLS